MAIGVAGGVQGFQLHRFAHFDDVTRQQTAKHAGNGTRRFGVCQHLGACGIHHRLVAANVVMVLMGVEYLGDAPALVFGYFQALGAVQRVYGQGLAGLRTSDKVVEVTVGVGSPNLFNQHGKDLGWGGVSLCKRKCSKLKSPFD